MATLWPPHEPAERFSRTVTSSFEVADGVDRQQVWHPSSTVLHGTTIRAGSDASASHAATMRGARQAWRRGEGSAQPRPDRTGTLRCDELQPIDLGTEGAHGRTAMAEPCATMAAGRPGPASDRQVRRIDDQTIMMEREPLGADRAHRGGQARHPGRARGSRGAKAPRTTVPPRFRGGARPRSR